MTYASRISVYGTIHNTPFPAKDPPFHGAGRLFFLGIASAAGYFIIALLSGENLRPSAPDPFSLCICPFSRPASIHSPVWLPSRKSGHSTPDSLPGWSFVINAWEAKTRSIPMYWRG